MITITQEFLRQGQSSAGGWNRKQIEAIGLSWPLRHGWQGIILGAQVTEEMAARFLALKGQTIRESKRQAQREAKTDLPLPPQIKPKLALTMMHHWAYLKRLDPDDLQAIVPALQYIARTCTAKTTPLTALSDHLDQNTI